MPNANNVNKHHQLHKTQNICFEMKQRNTTLHQTKTGQYECSTLHYYLMPLFRYRAPHSYWPIAIYLNYIGDLNVVYSPVIFSDKYWVTLAYFCLMKGSVMLFGLKQFCEFFTSDGLYFQRFYWSFFGTAVCGILCCSKWYSADIKIICNF